jgi:prepilin-type N-terminal cleavage/methylation domain-containing protein
MPIWLTGAGIDPMKRICRKGFTLVEIMMVVMIMAILMTIAVPNYVLSRNRSKKNACISNLKAIDSAKTQYVMENMLDTGAVVTTANLVPTYMRVFPTCPAAGTYSINTFPNNPTCSLSATKAHTLP